jgi:hypothetical protein
MKKCGKCGKCGKNAEKCGLNLWDFVKFLVCPDSGQGMGKKITSPKPRQNTAEKNKLPIMAHCIENWSK